VPDNIAILLPAMLAGQLVLARGIVFIDIAIAQVAALGVVAGYALLGGETHGLPTQACAAAAALLAAGFLAWTERRAGTAQEAVIGVVYVVAASAQIVLLGFDPHGAEHLKDLLVGQILWVAPAELLPIAVLYAMVLAALLWGDLSRRRLLFYAVFAVSITASVQLVGVLLVFASLIVPALPASRAVTKAGRLVAGYATGVLGYILGLAASAITDAPTGAAIVCALAFVASMTIILSPKSPRPRPN
jgi:zinc/manganese transport system permease protein